ncbi:MAG TPA: RNA 2',3'-cyclic phosphodiesterase [Nitrospiraceae bacterium]|jgi:2'-5' RNA ligase|nr:RNA 2',3'-cyclic phosphodiesterase [Nitrospiraceae bacterium]
MGLRCFIAIRLSDSLKQEVATVLDDLKRMNADVKWVTPENLHLTLKFLGDIDEGVVPLIRKKLIEISALQSSFTVKLSGMGFFPDKGRPRVVWIDSQDHQGLKNLKEKVEEAMITIGFAREDRTFSPHLTIGRVRTSKNLSSLLSRMQTLKDKDFGNIDVRLVSLMRSELKPKGAEYTTLAEFNFKEE